MKRVLCWIILLLLSSLVGCQGPATQPGYQTVGRDPRRDSDAAAILTQEGRQQLSCDKLDDAERTFKAALTADPFFGPAHNDLGIVYYRQKKFYYAAWEFQTAAGMMPSRGDPRNSLALVYEHVGRLDEAAKYFSEAVTLEPQESEFLGNYIRCRLRQGQRDGQTRSLLQKFLLLDQRPDWLGWARKELLTMPVSDNLPASTQPLLPPSTQAVSQGQQEQEDNYEDQ